MKIIAPILILFSLTGCVPFFAGAGAVVGLEAHQRWCVKHTGNIWCDRHLPMGVQK